MTFTRQNYRQSSKGNLYNKIEYALFMLVAILIVIAVWAFYIFILNRTEYLWFSIIIFIILLMGLICILKLAPLEYKSYSYNFDEKGITVVQGVLFKSKQFLPYNSIQDVTIEKGPILSKLKLTNVHVRGINRHIVIFAVEEKLGEEIKENILKERSKYNIEY